MNGLGLRVGDAQADEHDELRWQQYPVAQGPPKRILHNMHRIKVQRQHPVIRKGQPFQQSWRRLQMYMLSTDYDEEDKVLPRGCKPMPKGEALAQHLCKLVVSVEAMPVMLVQDTQLPQCIQADKPCTAVDSFRNEFSAGHALPCGDLGVL